MAIETKRKEGEPGAALLSRFTRRVKRGGILKEANRRRFYARPANRRARRLSALHREAKKQDFLRARKLGLV